MGNGNRGGLADGTEKAGLLECDVVGSDLRMQNAEWFPGVMAMPHFPHQDHHHHHPSPQTQSMGAPGFGGDSGGSGGGGPLYCNLSNQVACLSDTYDVVGDASAFASIVPRTSHPFPSDSFFKSSEGVMAAPAKVPFTASQWQELERQTTIYKYMLSSMPVPPELLVPNSRNPSQLPASQFNTTGFDLSFSRSSDPEPWRCRRTDGKKWRCSRDVAPYQKYCERHAHKSRPRSRKPVESQSHKTTPNFNTHPLVNVPGSTNSRALQQPLFHLPAMVSGATYCQPRCTELVVKEDSMTGSTFNNEWLQLMQSSSSSSRVGLKRSSEDHNSGMTVFEQQYREEQESMTANSYVVMGDDQILTTRHFIDAWASGKRDEIDEISNNCSVSSSGKLPLSSLNLSVSTGDGIDEGRPNAQTGIGSMDPESGNDGGFKSQWLNPVQWMSSPPGGPLGEALCLGIASTASAKTASNLPSPHGCSNSTNTSSCSKSSCEDSSHGQHFY